MTKGLEVRCLGPNPQPYSTIWAEQRRLHEARAADLIGDTVLLLQHEPVYTAGRRTAVWERPTDGTPVVEVDRGGRITWHGPGQLVGYPIVRLPVPLDLVAYVRRLEDVIMAVCEAFGLPTVRIDGRTGVWMPRDSTQPDRKLAAIGVRVARGVAFHGFALNVDPDLAGFEAIVPCGIDDAAVTSMSRELGRPISVADVEPVMVAHLDRLLGAPTRAVAVP